MAIDNARDLVKDGFLTFIGRRRGIPEFKEKTHGLDSTFKARWVKERGVSGGRYGMPYYPNGHYAQFMLVR